MGKVFSSIVMNVCTCVEFHTTMSPNSEKGCFRHIILKFYEWSHHDFLFNPNEVVVLIYGAYFVHTMFGIKN